MRMHHTDISEQMSDMQFKDGEGAIRTGGKKMNKLQIGDIIICHDKRDMKDCEQTLQGEGIKVEETEHDCLKVIGLDEVQ